MALNILFITQDDPFYIPFFFREFDRIFRDPEVRIHGVVIQAPLGKKSFRALLGQMLDFYGFRDFVRVGIKFAVYKLLNLVAVKACRGKFPGAFSVEHVLLRIGWPIYHARNVNAPEFLETIRSLHLDLIVSVAASQKFQAALMETPRMGCINIHNSKLPKNRGMLPNFWSLFRHDEEPVSAMTVHKMNANLDDGEIVLQEEIRLDARESLHELIIRTKQRNAHVILEAIRLFKVGHPPIYPNDSKLATYNTFPTKEDVRKFRAKGLRLL